MASKNKRAHIIPFDPEDDADKTEFVKHSRTITEADGSSDVLEERIPKLSEDATPYDILKFLAAFGRARTNLRWTTGPRLYQKFPVHLSGYHLEVWETTIEDDPNQTVANFNASLEDFKLELLQGYNYEDQMDYLRELCKPPKMDPSKFLLKLRAANRLAIQLPGAPDNNPGFSETQMKRVYLQAMPKLWQDNFENANMDVSNESLQDIR